MLNEIITWCRICASVGIVGISICGVALAGVLIWVVGLLVRDAIADRRFLRTILSVALFLIVLGVFVNVLLMLWNSIMAVLRMW